MKATDVYILGLTTTGRSPDTTAANAKAGTVMYLEKYNITDGNWGQGGNFPYLWQVSDESRAAAPSLANPFPFGTCEVETIAVGEDRPGGDIKVISTNTSIECGAAACAFPGCGGFVWISRKEDPSCLPTGAEAGCCFLKGSTPPPATKSGYKTIASALISGG